jgi:hypothetical protein
VQPVVTSPNEALYYQPRAFRAHGSALVLALDMSEQLTDALVVVGAREAEDRECRAAAIRSA